MVLIYVIGGIVMPSLEAKGIIGTIATRLLPVWIALAITFAASITFKRRLWLYGKLFGSTIGTVGLALVLFGLLTAILADLIITFEPMSAQDRRVVHLALAKFPGVVTKSEGKHRRSVEV